MIYKPLSASFLTLSFQAWLMVLAENGWHTRVLKELWRQEQFADISPGFQELKWGVRSTPKNSVEKQNGEEEEDGVSILCAHLPERALVPLVWAPKPSPADRSRVSKQLWLCCQGWIQQGKKAGEGKHCPDVSPQAQDRAESTLWFIAEETGLHGWAVVWVCSLSLGNSNDSNSLCSSRSFHQIRCFL